MNIVFYLGSLGNGGAERVVANLSAALCNQHSVMIVTSVNREIAYDFDEKVKIVALDDSNVPIANFAKRNVVRMQRLEKTVREFSADILIAFLAEPSFRSLLLKRKLRIPIIISQRNDPKKEYSSILWKIFMKCLYPKADGFVFQTVEQKKFFSKKIQEKSVIIANPVAKEYICNDYIYPQSRRIVSVGRLAKQKDYVTLIKAFKIFLQDNPNYELNVYGEGQERNALQQMINECGLEQQMFLCGREKNIKTKLLEAEFFVMSSEYEGMPNSLVEAMTVGLPVISTDCPCGGPKELMFKSDMGILTEVGNAEQLAEAMSKYAKEHEYAVICGKNARSVLEIVSPERVVEKWLAYIKTIYENYNT